MKPRTLRRLSRALDAVASRLGRLAALLDVLAEPEPPQPVPHPARGSLRTLRCSGCGCTYLPSWVWPGHETHCGACAGQKRGTC